MSTTNEQQDINVLERFKVEEPVIQPKKKPIEVTKKEQKAKTTTTTVAVTEEKHVTTDQTKKKDTKPKQEPNIFNPNPPIRYSSKDFYTILDTEGIFLSDRISKDKDGYVLWTEVYCELHTDEKLMQFKYNDGEIQYEVWEGRLSIVLDDGSAISINKDDRILIPRGKRHNVMNVIPADVHPVCRFRMNIQGELDFRTLLSESKD